MLAQLASANLTPDEVVERTKKDAQTYSDLQLKAGGLFTQRGRHIATFALRRYLYDHGIVMLPPARLTTPDRVKDPVHLTWDEASAICAASSKPYNLILRLMLHCGWGASEFLRFNTRITPGES